MILGLALNPKNYIVLIEDGHAQERSEFDSVLNKVSAQDLWCGDRNFCTLKFLFRIQKKSILRN